MADAPLNEAETIRLQGEIIKLLADGYQIMVDALSIVVNSKYTSKDTI